MMKDKAHSLKSNFNDLPPLHTGYPEVPSTVKKEYLSNSQLLKTAVGLPRKINSDFPSSGFDVTSDILRSFGQSLL